LIFDVVILLLLDFRVYMFYLDKLTNVCIHRIWVTSLSANLLANILDVVNRTFFLLFLCSMFCLAISPPIFIGLKGDLRFERIQINSRRFRIQMQIGYLAAFCGLCLFVIQLCYLVATAATARVGAPV
jgi:hypothetical protein